MKIGDTVLLDGHEAVVLNILSAMIGMQEFRSVSVQNKESMFISTVPMSSLVLIESEPKITITLKEYESLLDSADQLRCLEAGGVDNWQWYDEALKDYYSAKEDT